MDVAARKIGSVIERADNLTQYFHIASEPVTLPSSIPSTLKNFVDREKYLNDLCDWYTSGKRVFVLHGLGGTGKTSLAVKFAEVIKSDHDSHIFIDLQGASKNPLHVTEIMWHVITSFDPLVKYPQIPFNDSTGELLSKEEQHILVLNALQPKYISLMNQHKVLLILDNASNETQVEPLNKLDSGCLIVTSRKSFYLNGGETKEIEEMLEGEAVQLLENIVGKQRLEDKGGAIAKLCGYLPLALRAAGGTLRNKRTLKVSRYAEMLIDKKERLRLHNPERNQTVEASFSLSYDLLLPSMRQKCRQLAVFPEYFDGHAAAMVWDVNFEKAEQILAELDSSSLIKWNEATNRFKLHDLVRDFLDNKLNKNERAVSQRRHSKFYAMVLFAGNELIKNSIKAALDLIDLEWINIITGQKWSEGMIDIDEEAAWIYKDYTGNAPQLISLRLSPEEFIEWHNVGLRADRKLNIESEFHFGEIGLAHFHLGNFHQAIDYFNNAMRIAQEKGHRQNEAIYLGNLGATYLNLKDSQKSIDYFEKALQFANDIKDERGEIYYLVNMATIFEESGEKEKAFAMEKQALQAARQLNDKIIECKILTNLGTHFVRSGDNANGFEYYEKALKIACELGDKKMEEILLENLEKNSALDDIG